MQTFQKPAPTSLANQVKRPIQRPVKKKGKTEQEKTAQAAKVAQ